MPDILTTHALIDDVLDTFRDVLGPHAVRYRNHVYRGVNYQRKLLQLTTIPDEIALAWALHDIGIWTSGWDYIQPSLHQVDELAPRYRVAHVDRVRQMVEWHHKVRPCRDDWWVETFRVADRIDVTRGLLPRRTDTIGYQASGEHVPVQRLSCTAGPHCSGLGDKASTEAIPYASLVVRPGQGSSAPRPDDQSADTVVPTYN